MSDKYQNALVLKWGAEFYYVQQDTWMKEKVPDELKAEVTALIAGGTILASMPTSGQTIGSVCYLVDLSAIAPKD